MSAALVLDTNMIILLVVGLADEALVSKHKRTRAYSINDFRLLVHIISNYQDVTVVPNALSEVSNLLSFEADDRSRTILAVFSNFVESTNERYVASVDAIKRPEFRWLGLSDSAMLELAKTDIHLLTADLDLHLAALKAGYQSFNFTHMIEAARI